MFMLLTDRSIQPDGVALFLAMRFLGMTCMAVCAMKELDGDGAVCRRTDYGQVGRSIRSDHNRNEQSAPSVHYGG